jgi:glycosyltransferase involved in cell wall biosynthesis
LREVCGRHAQFIDPQDEAGWFDAMWKLAEDDDWRAELGRGGVNFSRRYTWRQCAEDTWQTYERVLSPCTSPAQEPLLDLLNRAA